MLPYHRHDAYEIYLFLSGNTKFYIEKACYQLKVGNLVIIRPDEMHRSICLDNEVYERIGVNIKKSKLESLSSGCSSLLTCFEARAKGQNNFRQLSIEQLQFFTQFANKLHKSLCSDEYGQDILADAYLSQLLVFINTLYKNSTHAHENIMPELIRDTMEYIEEHLTENITLEDLSREFCFNGDYISYKFKEHTGLTLRGYILEQRIALAKKLLSEDKNVSETCYLSGFMDYANFIRSFTKLVGISPGKYKKQLPNQIF